MRFIVLLILLLPFNAIAEQDFVYPASYKKDYKNCQALVKEAYAMCAPLFKYEATYLYDLNGDGVCELFVHDEQCGSGGLWFSIHEVSGDGTKYIGTTYPGFWLGEPYNGYAQILLNGYFWHHTNPSFTVNVQRYEGGECQFYEGRPEISYGGYSDLGAKYYKNGNYKKAEHYFLNRYRMSKEPSLKIANDLAITWIKLEKLSEAKDLLTKHLEQQTGDPKDLSSAHFNFGIVYEKENNKQLALSEYIKANELHPSSSSAKKIATLTSD